MVYCKHQMDRRMRQKRRRSWRCDDVAKSRKQRPVRRAHDRRPERPPVDDRFRDDRDGMDAGVRDGLRIRSAWRPITPYGGQRGIERVLDREVTEAAASRALSTVIRT